MIRIVQNTAAHRHRRLSVGKSGPRLGRPTSKHRMSGISQSQVSALCGLAIPSPLWPGGNSYSDESGLKKGAGELPEEQGLRF
jgi:hypothetical protein